MQPAREHMRDVVRTVFVEARLVVEPAPSDAETEGDTDRKTPEADGQLSRRIPPPRRAPRQPASPLT